MARDAAGQFEEPPEPIPTHPRELFHDGKIAVPAPKIAIAVSACAIAVGPFVGYAHHQEDASAHLPMDLFIPGGPPHLLTILDGRWHLLGKLETGS